MARHFHIHMVKTLSRLFAEAVTVHDRRINDVEDCLFKVTIRLLCAVALQTVTVDPAR